MFTVALIGPDGSGKSTVGRLVERDLSLPVKYLYMGVNLEASNVMLPTTRLLLELRRAQGVAPESGPPDPTKRKHLSRNPIKRLLQEAKSAFRMANLIAEEWFRQAFVTIYRARGFIVLCDRHFYPEYYATDVLGSSPRTLARRVHGFQLKCLYPKPDLVLCFDAPAEVLHARKGEGTIETLDERRRMYLGMERVVTDFTKVDVSRPVDDVARDVARLIEEYAAARAGRVPAQER